MRKRGLLTVVRTFFVLKRISELNTNTTVGKYKWRYLSFMINE